MSILIDSVTRILPPPKSASWPATAWSPSTAISSTMLDYRFYMIDTALTVEVERDSKPLTFHIKKEEYDELGWNLPITSWIASTTAPISAFSASSISCPAACAKPSYFKDDDSRMSFLFGSYVTSPI